MKHVNYYYRKYIIRALELWSNIYWSCVVGLMTQFHATSHQSHYLWRYWQGRHMSLTDNRGTVGLSLGSLITCLHDITVKPEVFSLKNLRFGLCLIIKLIGATHRHHIIKNSNFVIEAVLCIEIEHLINYQPNCMENFDLELNKAFLNSILFCLILFRV